MTYLITDTALTLWRSGRKTKQNAAGWISANAICCHHKGEKPDRKGRGGIHTDGSSFSYHCFNCGFKAGWSPGKLLSNNTKLWFKWLGVDDTEISRLNLYALKKAEDLKLEIAPTLNFTLEPRHLPDGAVPIADLVAAGFSDPSFIAVLEYLLTRCVKLDWCNFYWTDAPGYKDRVIIPFTQDGVIVGHTARKITSGNPKYLTDSQKGYVFNIDHQTSQRQVVLVVEGPFDAIAVDGVAILTNEPNDTQSARINALGKNVVVVPDRDAPGAALIGAALKNGWNISLPPWDHDVKDAADAVARYGRCYTLASILHYVEHNPLKIQIAQKKLLQLR